MSPERLVHVIDDDDAVRDSLAFLLETAGHAVKSYESAVSFLEASAAGGCIITDMRMPEMNGLELAARLKERGDTRPVIVITGHGDIPLAVQAMKAGVADFIEKPFDDEAILRAVDAALSQIESSTKTDGQHADIKARLAKLSERELQVLDALMAGKPNKVTAYDLGISPRTVEIYRANVMTKMRAQSLSELIRMAMLAGRGD